MPAARAEERVLLLAPAGRDAAAMAAVLNGHGVAAEVCDGPAEAVRRMESGAGALLLTEEALEFPRFQDLLEHLKSQPPWSELPLIILTGGGESRLAKALNVAADAAGSLTLLERPLGTITLLRSVQVALRSRRRQYQMRDLLAEVRGLNARLEARVLERTREFTAANAELEAFCYSVAHDLRTPLRGIEGFSRLLLRASEEKLDAEEKDYFQRIRAASQKMALLIDGLLELARLVRMEMRHDAVDMSGMAAAISNDLKRRDPDRRVELTVAPGLQVAGDERLIHALLTNLLENAWKFTGRHPTARIELGVTEKDGERVYFVRDDGAGFDQAFVGRLFKPFERLHVGDFPGTGIGLATVQRILHRHGGRIWAEGAVERGATFYFTLSKSAPVKETYPDDRRRALRRAGDRRQPAADPLGAGVAG